MTEPGAPRLLLAIESATRIPSVALVRDGQQEVVRVGDGTLHHAESVLPLVDAVLGEAGVALGEIDAFAIAIGPGGFTSLRIGLSTLKGLAFGSTCPVAPVSTLAAQAWEHAGALPVVSMLDARRGELYAAVYEGTRDGLRESVGEGIYTPEVLATRLPERCRLAGEAVPMCAEQLRELRGPGVEIAASSGVPRAVAIAALGAHALARGAGVAVAELAPRYLRRPQAEEAREARQAPGDGSAAAL